MSTTVLVVTTAVEMGLVYCWFIGSLCKGLAWTSRPRRHG